MSQVKGTGYAAGKALLSPTTSRYVVRPGDTPEIIAQRVLGDANRWPEIEAMNIAVGLGDALSGLKPGTTLVVPRATDKGAKTADGESEADVAKETRAANGKKNEEVTRASFLAKLLPQGPADPADMMDFAKSLGLVNKGGEAGRPGAAIKRSEAAVILSRYAGIAEKAAPGNVYFFSDMIPGTWYFQAVHDCRLYGILDGNKANCFHPSGQLSEAGANDIIDRAKKPQIQSLDDQSEGLGVEALEQPQNLDALLNERKTLNATRIDRARELIEQLPKSERGPAYEVLASKVKYRNQRNNVGEFRGDGDSMCNWTSISMALNNLGIGMNEKKGQMEDQIDRKHKGDRYSRASRGAFVENQFGLDQSVRTVSFSNPSSLKAWFEKNVKRALERGGVATMGNPKRGTYPYSHIVRIEWVEDGGLKVDDPFGKAHWDGSKYTYRGSANATNTEKGVGRDNFWTWKALSQIATNGASYVHLFFS